MKKVKVRSAFYYYDSSEFCKFQVWGIGVPSDGCNSWRGNINKAEVIYDDLFTNTFDWRGTEIFENDILLEVKTDKKYIVEYSEQGCMFFLRDQDSTAIKDFISLAAIGSEDGIFFTGVEVIGNKHEGIKSK